MINLFLKAYNDNDNEGLNLTCDDDVTQQLDVYMGMMKVDTDEVDYEKFIKDFCEKAELTSDVYTYFCIIADKKVIANEIDSILELLEESYNWDNCDEENFIAIYKNYSNDVADALKIVVNDEFRYIGEGEEYAREIVEECYDVPDNLLYYFDFEKMWNDMEMEGNFIETLDGDGYLEIY